MKLAIVVPGGFARDPRAGVIPALVDLAGELATRHAVHVFPLYKTPEEARYRLRGADVHQVMAAVGAHHNRAERVLRRALAFGRQFDDAGADGRFDLIHAFWANEPGLLACLIGRARRIPVVVSVGGAEIVSLPTIRYGATPVWRALTSAVLRLANDVTAGSELARSLLAPRVRARAHLIPLGVDPARFAAPPERGPGPPWRLLHVGSLNRVKDHATLLAAFAAVRARLGDVHLDCVGEDTLGGSVQRRARELGLERWVTFHGLLSPEGLKPLFHAAHLHVVSSRYESQAVVILEAATAGLPTVGTAVGLLPSLSPAAGRCVSPGDAPALADAICALLTDERTRLALGTAAKQVAQNHTIARAAHRFERVYERNA